MSGYRKFSNISNLSRPTEPERERSALATLAGLAEASRFSERPETSNAPTSPATENQTDPAKVANVAKAGVPYGRTLAALIERCPDYVEPDRWERAVDDGRAFVTTWGPQAQALGWTPRDLFGLHTPPSRPRPSYQRLARYDETGLVWLLDGRPVTLLSSVSAVIANPTGATTVYRKDRKPCLGPTGDSLDDLSA
jgi:hypothetical protein